MNRFFVDTPLQLNHYLTLPETVFHHWVRVLRAQQGEQAILFNGLGGEFVVQLTEVNKKDATVHLLSHNPQDRTPVYEVVLGQVMSKGDRMDYAIQKATELGVHKIQLLVSERCEMRLKYDRDQKKLEHWQQVAIAACEQCGMNRVPEILAPLSIDDWLHANRNNSTLKLVLAPNQAGFTLPTPLPKSIQLLVGPEGGLSDNEINQVMQYGFHCWTLGSRILRTETAPVVALSALLFAAG